MGAVADLAKVESNVDSVKVLLFHAHNEYNCIIGADGVNFKRNGCTMNVFDYTNFKNGLSNSSDPEVKRILPYMDQLWDYSSSYSEVTKKCIALQKYEDFNISKIKGLVKGSMSYGLARIFSFVAFLLLCGIFPGVLLYAIVGWLFDRNKKRKFSFLHPITSYICMKREQQYGELRSKQRTIINRLIELKSLIINEFGRENTLSNEFENAHGMSKSNSLVEEPPTISQRIILTGSTAPSEDDLEFGKEIGRRKR